MNVKTLFFHNLVLIMFVTYTLPEVTEPYGRFHTTRPFEAAVEGEYPTRFKAVGERKHLAALVNIKDHRFLEAARELVRRINEHNPEANITLHAFLQTALKKTLDENARVSKEPNENYKENLNLNGRVRVNLESFKAVGLGNVSIILNRTLKKAGVSEPAQVALISIDDHDFLQALRKVFQSSSGGVQLRFAKNILREFANATGTHEIEGTLFHPITGVSIGVLNPTFVSPAGNVNINAYAPA